MKLAYLDRARVAELFRFYQAAIINAVFGISLYVVLVRLGINLFAAQGISHVTGVVFNYFTYRNHVFRDAASAKTRFLISYTVNYFINLAFLVCIRQFINSSYTSGILTSLMASMVNYFSLKLLVFRKRAK